MANTSIAQNIEPEVSVSFECGDTGSDENLSHNNVYQTSNHHLQESNHNYQQNQNSGNIVTFTLSGPCNPTSDRHSIYEHNYSSVEAKTRCLVLGHQQLKCICSILEQEFKRGLHRDTNKIADIKMLPTHICDKPAAYTTLGHFVQPDEGKFLALDLGGTNFRVILIELEKQNFHMENETYALSRDLMTGPGSDLFDYIATCLHTFVQRHSLQNVRLPLGFTFSFPCVQESLSHARLVAWTKGFTCSGVEGRDVCELLREALERRSDLDIEVMAVLNDTVGTLISCAHQNRECRVGLIVGTGTNACYMERVDQVHRMHGYLRGRQSVNSCATAAHRLANSNEATYCQDGSDLDHSGNNSYLDADLDERDTTVVNTEWGAFGDNGALDFVRTRWDLEMDAASEEAGRQRFEKMIGGLYIGELCRRVMLDMAQQGLIFNPANHSNSSTIDGRREDDDIEHYVDARDQEQDLDQNKQPVSRLMRKRKSIISTGSLNKPFSFPSSLVSFVEKDLVDEYVNTKQALKEAFGIDWASAQDCASVKLICARVTTRAAHLVAAAVACLLNKMQRTHTVVGVDGSMFRYHPHFRSIMAIKAKELTNPSYKFQLMFAEDGSGRGAAIMAAVACRQRRISSQLNLDKQAQAALASLSPVACGPDNH